MFEKNPLEELRQGQFLHSSKWNWLSALSVLLLFPLGFVLSKNYGGCLFYALLAVEAALLIGSVVWLKYVSRRAIFVTIFLMLVSVCFIHSFAVVYALLGICADNCSSADPTISNDLYSSVYFSVVSWTTLGYGDFQPLGWVRLIASMEALFGYIFMGIVVGFTAQITYEIVKNSNSTNELQKSLSKEVGYEGEPEQSF